MSNEMIVDLTLAGLLTIGGLLCAPFDRRGFAWRWLAVAVLLVALNNILLANGYGLLPDLIGGEWRWQGKLLALAGTLAVAASPGFGWRRSGLTLTQRPGSLRVAIPVVLVYCLYPVAIALIFGGSTADPEALAFQLTMPGFEEEAFFRGVLLLALDQAFRGRIGFAGVEWGFGALLSCALFGLVHALSYRAGGYGFDPLTCALTGLPAFVAVWVRYRTGSVLLPIILHNFGNSIQMAFK